jgi:hypothetical protein
MPESRPSNHTEAQLCRFSLEDNAIPMSFRAARCLRVFQLPSQDGLSWPDLAVGKTAVGSSEMHASFSLTLFFVRPELMLHRRPIGSDQGSGRPTLSGPAAAIGWI